ncbi:MAG: thiamine pyrophosphate-binding protein [Deltaproteobacteria bacterium]|nr:thiamine pyrophosphate-binding protein [Deltaproteobacteria bacterium]
MELKIPGRRNHIKGGELVSRALAVEGVTRVFGIIDGSYFGFYSTLGEHGIEIVTPRHETSAAHMAGAYARLTGKLGVCMASNGPGVANVLPGVAVEQAEGNRVLLVTSSRRVGITHPDRGGAYQYFPHVEVTRPMCKWAVSVPSADRLPELTRKAMRASFEGRPGVVHLDIPESILNGELESPPDAFGTPDRYRAVDPITPTHEQVRAAARMLVAAKRPLLHVGSGALHSGACSEVMALAELLEAPLTTSWGARAAVDERRRQVIPMIYVDAVNRARASADAVMILGSRLGETDWWGKAPYWGTPDQQQTIWVDIDPDVLGSNRPADLAIRADLKTFAALLLAEIRGHRIDLTARRGHLEELKVSCANRRAELDKHLDDKSLPMSPAHVAHVCQRVFADDAIMVADGGNTTIWAQFFHQVRAPGSLLGTPKMGMLGAGVSQALGAKVAAPGRQVYCIIGDGAMGFHPQEIETAVRNQLPVIYLVLADKQWGMVKMNQQFALKPIKTLVMKSLSPEETIKADLSETEWDQLARSMGAHGERVADPRGLEEALRRAIASGRPAVIHVDVDPVKHMWAPNLKTFKDMHGEPRP